MKDTVGEGTGENIFFVEDGELYTPDIGSSVLKGITRNTIITIAEDLGYKVREETIPREKIIHQLMKYSLVVLQQNYLQ